MVETVLGELALSLILELVASAIEKGVEYTALGYFERRKINRRIEDATAEVVEPLLPFLAAEKIPEDKQRRLIEMCVDELRPLTEQPEYLFRGSLDGQKIFEQTYSEGRLPEVLIEDGTDRVYSLLFPRIATVLCTIPAAVKDWESQAWTENFARLDDIASQLRALFIRVDEMAEVPKRQADETLSTVRRGLAQKVALDLDLTGLRADRPFSGKLDDFFVHPIITKRKEKDEEPDSVSTPNGCFACFIQRRQWTVVVGAPGAGKSTWTKWLQRYALESRWQGIAVRVELRRFSSGSLPSRNELIRAVAGKHLAEALTEERIGQWLDATRVIFVLDGFDEIPPDRRDEVYEWVVDLSVASRGCPFVLTSRPLTTDHLDRLGAAWQQWIMEPFDHERIVDYIQRWYAHTPLLLDSSQPVDAQALASQWASDPTVAPLTGNPLLLSTILMVHHLDGRLPTGRSQLYRRYVDGMLGLWDDRRAVVATTLRLTVDQKRRVLRGLALKMFLQGRDQLDEPAMIAVAREVVKEVDSSLNAEDVLAELRERSGLIVGPGIYSFVHKSVAEYLVAETVLQGDQRDDLRTRIDRLWLLEHRDDDQWNSVIFLWAGLAPTGDLEAFIDACIDAESMDLAYGLVWDQYEHVPMTMCRQFMLRNTYGLSMQLGRADTEEGTLAWVHSSPAALYKQLIVPVFPLRSLAYADHRPERRYYVEPELSSLVDRVVRDGVITWSDHVYMPGRLRDLLWMSTIHETTNVDEWRDCLRSGCPTVATSEHWLFWAIETLSHPRQPEGRVSAIEAFVKAFREACPDARGLVLLALISEARNLLQTAEFLSSDVEYLKRGIRPPTEREREESVAFSIQYLKRVLPVLPAWDDGTIAPNWLLGTLNWQSNRAPRYAKSRPEEPDLLRVFCKQLKELADQGMIERNTTYQQAVIFVEELITRREALASQDERVLRRRRPKKK